MTSLSQFLPRLLVFTPACSDPLAMQALLDSAIEFCEKTGVLSARIDPVYLVTSAAEYEIESPVANTEVFLATKAQVDGSDVETVMADARPLGDLRVARPDKVYVVLNSDCSSTFALNTMPDMNYQLTAEVLLRPTRTATSLPDVLFTRWVDALISGALARLYMIPNQAFSSPVLAQYYETRAAKLRHNAKIDASYGGARGTLTVKQRPFA